ncbi:MAG: DNA-binding response OmpR family regulator [Candidatus Azotimanducaceae bacterium]
MCSIDKLLELQTKGWFDMAETEAAAVEAAERKKPTVLFVDDDERCLKLLGRVFEHTNYQCLYASSGLSALEIVRSRTIDAIVSDLRMPGMSGSELLESVRSIQPDTVRIAVSGALDVTDTIDTINKGAVSSYILKPIVPKDLKLTIYKEILSRDKKKNELDRVKASRKSSADIARELGSSLYSIKCNLEEYETAIFDLVEILANLDAETLKRAMLRKRLVMQLATKMSIAPIESREAAMAALTRELEPDLLKATSFQNSTSTFFQNVREHYSLEGTSDADGEPSSVLREIVEVSIHVDRMVNLEGIDDVNELIVRLSSEQSISLAVLSAVSELELF